MKIKINDKVICFPPYISTTWEYIKFLQVEHDPISHTEILIITLTEGSRIKIPHLDQKVITAIFAAHLKHIENANALKEKQKMQNPLGNLDIAMGFPLRLGMAGLEGIGSILQHNPAQSDIPDLPPEVLSKITAIAKIVGQDDLNALPKPVDNCRCLHCQIARAIQQTFGSQENLIDEEITEEDLRFRLWDISQNGEKLYTVTNPLDSQEQYNVFLGEPIGCTCGNPNCEHIRAVLNS